MVQDKTINQVCERELNTFIMEGKSVGDFLDVYIRQNIPTSNLLIGSWRCLYIESGAPETEGGGGAREAFAI